MKTSGTLLSLAALSAASALTPRASSLQAVTVKGNGKEKPFRTDVYYD